MMFIKTRESFYQQHRLRVQAAKKVVDNSPPRLDTRVLTRIHYHTADAEQFNRIKFENRHNLVDINRILRIRGLTESFQSVRESRSPRIMQNIKLVQKIQVENCRLGNRLLKVMSRVTHRPPTPKIIEHVKKTHEFELPTNILEKYQNLRIPKEMHWKHLLLRPTIYFDMSIAGISQLGRLVIQLYTEACPQVVLEFVRFCVDQNPERLSFVRLFPKLWLEAELSLEKNVKKFYNLDTPKIEYDMRAIDHGEQGNVLSFSSENLKGFNEGYINFSLSFKPLRVLNGKRVGFGRIIQGNKILASLIDYGNKIGRSRRKIVLSGCGVL